MAFTTYPANLENDTWQSQKSALAGKTGVGDKLKELKKAHADVDVNAFLPAKGLKSMEEFESWKEGVESESVKALKLQKLAVAFSQFANSAAGDLKKKKMCPSKTRELVEKMSSSAKKLALDVGVCLTDIQTKLKDTEKSLTPAKTVTPPKVTTPPSNKDAPPTKDDKTDTELLTHLKAAKTSQQNFVVALGKVPGLVLAKTSLTGTHRQEAKALAGGSGHLIEGTVIVEGAAFVFVLDAKPPGGLAAKIKKAIGLQTNLKSAKVKVRGGGVEIDGDTDVDDDTSTNTPTPNVSPQGTTAPKTLSPNQELLRKLNYNHGAMDRAAAQNLMADAPVGTWLVRFSPNQNQSVVTKKMGDGKFLHLLSLKEDGTDLAIAQLMSENKLDPNHLFRPGDKFDKTSSEESESHPSSDEESTPNPTHTPTTPPQGTGTVQPTVTDVPETEGLSTNQQALRKLPFNHGPLDRGAAEKLLASAPPGSWLLRFSPGQKQSVISRKGDDGKFVHGLSIDESGKDLTMSELLHKFNLATPKVVRPGAKGGIPPNGSDLALEGIRAKIHQIIDVCAKNIPTVSAGFANELKAIQQTMNSALTGTDLNTMSGAFDLAKQQTRDILARAKKMSELSAAIQKLGVDAATSLNTAGPEHQGDFNAVISGGQLLMSQLAKETDPEKIRPGYEMLRDKLADTLDGHHTKVFSTSKATIKIDIFKARDKNGEPTTPNLLLKDSAYLDKIALQTGLPKEAVKKQLTAMMNEMHQQTKALLPPGFVKPHGDKNTINPILPEEARPKLNLTQAKAVNVYSTNAYKQINPKLWTGGIPEPPHDKTHRDLQEAFALTKPFSEPVPVSRGVSFDTPQEVDNFLKKYRDAEGTDNLVTMTGYISTGTVGTPPDFQANIELVIIAKQALDLQPYSAYPNEKELLLNHQTPVKVHSVVKKGNNWVVTLEQILPTI